MSKPAEVIRKMPILEKDFGLSIHKHQSYSVYVPAAYEEADIQNPENWRYIAKRMQAGSDIRIMADDMTWVVYGIVLSSSGDIKILSSHDLDPKHAEPTSDYEVTWRGPRKYGIMNKKTGECFKDGIASKAQALAELDDYMRALGR